ncbi:hypothetical protein BDZ45DRAFT_669979 [Acephala macrosclerotiorum]|nr:hypothetical protein BDZ45DRAFT_669979 [Acephala macrosclerotiorum]
MPILTTTTVTLLFFSTLCVTASYGRRTPSPRRRKEGRHPQSPLKPTTNGRAIPSPNSSGPKSKQKQKPKTQVKTQLECLKEEEYVYEI